MTCGTLFPPGFGEITFTMDRAFGSEAIYSCFTGFEILGMESRFCQADGQWNGTAPICESELRN